MKIPTKMLYDMWVPFLLQHQQATKWRTSPHRGVLITSTRGFSLQDGGDEPILVFGEMGGTRMTVHRPLIRILPSGSFQMRTEDSASAYSYIWEDEVMFLRKMYHGRRAFLTIRDPYEASPTSTQTYLPRYHYYYNPRLRKGSDWRLTYMYRTTTFLSYFANGGVMYGEPTGLWLTIDNQILDSPRLVIAPETPEPWRYDTQHVWLRNQERYSEGVFRRVAKRVEGMGGVVHRPPTRVSCDDDAVAAFSANIDIYSNNPRPQEAMQ